jgi:hypothetical protein
MAARCLSKPSRTKVPRPRVASSAWAKFDFLVSGEPASITASSKAATRQAMSQKGGFRTSSDGGAMARMRKEPPFINGLWNGVESNQSAFRFSNANDVAEDDPRRRGTSCTMAGSARSLRDWASRRERPGPGRLGIAADQALTAVGATSSFTSGNRQGLETGPYSVLPNSIPGASISR